MTRQEKKEELIGLFSTGAISIGDLIDECFDFGQQHPRWTSVEDELPCENDIVRTINSQGDESVGYYTDGEWWNIMFTEEMSTIPITHWMPLTEEPETEEE